MSSVDKRDTTGAKPKGGGNGSNSNRNSKTSFEESSKPSSAPSEEKDDQQKKCEVTSKRTESTSSAASDAANAGNALPNGGESTETVNMVRSITLTSFGGIRNVKVQPRPELILGENEVTIKVKSW